ncbi:MAG: carbohydrate kinase family protein [Patescibacteria group bacterium]
MFDVITIGAATRDVFLVSKEFQIINSPRFAGGQGECVALGSKIDVDELVFSTGGGATNAATTFARLGFSSAVVARIGNDDPGAAIVTELKQYHVNTELLRVLPKENTAYSTLLTAKNGERSVLVHRGASSSFSASDIPWKNLKSQWLYITSLAGNIELLQKIVTQAKKQGTKVAVNPGRGELKRAVEMRELLSSLSVLIVNLEEAQMLAESDEKDGAKLAKLLAYPGLTVIVTNGARGAHAHADGKTWFARTSGAKSVSRTGAGDAFGSGTVAAIAKGWSLDDALRVGTLNAESVIQKFGAKAGILSKWPNKKQLSIISVKQVR